jgi:multicomponent Na+:H+ antiporter subunit C
MSEPIAYIYASVLLILTGMGGVLACGHILRKVIALNILGSGVFLLLVAFAYRSPHDVPDPVPHAMVLTGIVVAVSATALALALARRLAVSPTETGRTSFSTEASGREASPSPGPGEV